jgi:hypothetical protein
LYICNTYAQCTYGKNSCPSPQLYTVFFNFFMRCVATCAGALYVLFIMYVFINCFNLRIYYRIACEYIYANNNEVDEKLMIQYMIQPAYDTNNLKCSIIYVNNRVNQSYQTLFRTCRASIKYTKTKLEFLNIPWGLGIE